VTVEDAGLDELGRFEPQRALAGQTLDPDEVGARPRIEDDAVALVDLDDAVGVPRDDAVDPVDGADDDDRDEDEDASPVAFVVGHRISFEPCRMCASDKRYRP
jgi:hypothetical protein